MGQLKSYRFGAIASAGSTIPATYSTLPVVGEIVKVVWDYGTPIDANGSVWLGISGVGNPEVHRINGFGADSTVYPFTYLVDNVEVTGSPQAFGRFYSAEPLFVAGSGLGSPFNAITDVVVYFY